MVPALESASPGSCKTQPTFIESICPNNYPEKSKDPKNAIQLPTNFIALPWPTYTELRTKRGRLGTRP